MNHECDVLVIGGGGAAVRAAVEAAREGTRVLLVDKGSFERSGTSPLSLHGLATVLHPDDSEEILIADIFRNGYEINDLDLVQTAVRESRYEPALLEKMSVRFVKGEGGGYHFYRGAGHSAPHGVTYDDEGNGINFVAVLAKEAWKRGVRFIDEMMIFRLLVDNGTVVGAMGLDQEGRLHRFSAGAVVLAAGGANRIYPNVVPRIANDMWRTTGDGYILALQAGLPLIDMEFANFRDTPPASRMGGRYMNAKGEAFMERYEPERKEKAPRGKVVDAIFKELQNGNGPIYIEIDEECIKSAEFLPEEYKAYVRAYKEGKRPPVSVTFQRLLGGAGIRTDASSDIRGLFIAGENCGGFHGGDRLQAAAFLETQVFGRFAGIGAMNFAKTRGRTAEIRGSLIREAEDWIAPFLQWRDGVPAAEILANLHRTTWNHISILRNAAGLKTARAELAGFRNTLTRAVGTYRFEVFEVLNLVRTAEVMVQAALLREETRGTHHRSDYPEMRREFSRKHTSIRMKTDGELEGGFIPSRERDSI